MFRFFIVWGVAILATFLQTYFQRIPEHKPPLQVEVYVNSHSYILNFIQSYDGAGDAEIKLPFKRKGVAGRIFFRNQVTEDEWVYSDLHWKNGFLIGSIPRYETSNKTEYFFEFTENSEIISVYRDHPIVLTFEGVVPKLALGCYFAVVFFSLLSSNISGLSLVSGRLSYRFFSVSAVSFFLVLALVLSPLVQYYSLASKTINIISFVRLIDMKFLFWGVVWLIVSVYEWKKEKPTLIGLTSTALFVSDIVPRCFD